MPAFDLAVFFFQNLDVNLAVNNLLSRDEDDGDDDENPEYLPGGETVHCQKMYFCLPLVK